MSIYESIKISGDKIVKIKELQGRTVLFDNTFVFHSKIQGVD